MDAHSRIEIPLSSLLEQKPPRAGSLAVTVFGDYIVEQGGSVWLASLTEVMAEFGLNARQVRTAIFRLGQDGWLQSRQLGRRSYYALSADGRAQFTRASARIYAAESKPWDGNWVLLMPGQTDSGAREELRKRLGWLGFGALPNGVLAHPRCNDEALNQTLEELGLAGSVSVWRARPDNAEVPGEWVDSAWDVAGTAARYQEFITDFTPFQELLTGGCVVTERDAFVLRSLLIHNYRRVLLGTTDLPPSLLPSPWSGATAMSLVKTLYAALQVPATRYACTRLSNAEGPLPPPTTAFFSRFGGLAHERQPEHACA